MNRIYEEFKNLLDKACAMDAAIRLFELDEETLAPEGSAENTSKIVANLSSQYHDLITNQHIQDLVAALKNEDGLSETEKAIVRETDIIIEKLVSVPVDEYSEFSGLKARAGRIWADAKKKKDFELFAPTLKSIIGYQKKFASYRTKPGESLYCNMLQYYEWGFDTDMLDDFFEKLKEGLVPLLKRITKSKKQIDSSFLIGNFPEKKQRELAEWAAGHLNFDWNKGILSVSEHPFTTNFHNKDVRITTHYSDDVTNSLFSVIHEAGHGLYEFGISDELTMTPAGEGASAGMHEAQSRFYENIIGRNKCFLGPVFDKICELFPEQMDGVTLTMFWEAVNKVTPGPIRTEADELTYSLHILIRYELEKALMDGDLAVEKLPDAWNEKYKEYLGIEPKDAAEGILQDVHWSQGDFGYFPSYALGNAFGVQIYAHMCREMNIDKLLEHGELYQITEYLKEQVHKYGKLKSSLQIIKDTTGEAFNPDYYIRYLTDKYEALYLES